MGLIARLFAFSIGAIFGGLVLGLKDLLPYLDAQRTGVIRRRGHNRLVIRREEDPDRFASLLRNRTGGMAMGFGLCGLGLLGVVAFGAILFGVMRG